MQSEWGAQVSLHAAEDAEVQVQSQAVLSALQKYVLLLKATV